MSQLGLQHDVSASTFNHYVKSLRKLGLPFGKNKSPSDKHRNATYSFDEVMELAVALLLRVYATLPDAVVAGLIRFREDLRTIYRQAYFDSLNQTFPPARISALSARQMTITGIFLDLNIRYSAGRMVGFGPPQALSPFDALKIYVESPIPARSYLPLNVTAVAAMIVARTRVLPSTRRRRSR
jgi:hypothetical protein